MKEVIQLIGKTLLSGFTAKNLNPVKTPSTGVAAVAAGAAVAIQAYPQNEYDALSQLVLAVLATYFFYKQPQK